MPKIKIKYDPNNGTPIRDGEVYAWADDKVKWYKDRKDTKNTLVSKVASELCIDALRIKVKEGEIHHKDLIFVYGEDNEEIIIDKYGHISHYPNGFCDTFENILNKLIDLNMKD